MAYKQYTRCVQPADHAGLGAGMLAAAIAALALLVSGVGLGALAVGACLALLAYCRWWLYDRLVCL